MRSPTLLPQASTDKPKKDLLRLLTTPSVLKTATTSLAMDEMTRIDPTNEPNTANAFRKFNKRE